MSVIQREVGKSGLKTGGLPSPSSVGVLQGHTLPSVTHSGRDNTLSVSEPLMVWECFSKGH